MRARYIKHWGFLVEQDMLQYANPVAQMGAFNALGPPTQDPH